jgi:GTP-binding protein
MVNETELKQRFKRAAFIASSPDLEHATPDQGFEIAFAGRSNAGKSSAINVLTDQHDLARVSKTPGRTQHLVFFDLGEQRRLVDLPGYGYAKVPEAVKASLGKMIDRYLRERQTLQALVLIMDIRHPLTDFDWQMLRWAQGRKLPMLALLTKSDKLKRGPALDQLRAVKAEIARTDINVAVELFSAETKLNVPQIRWQLAYFLRWAEALPSPAQKLKASTKLNPAAAQ